MNAFRAPAFRHSAHTPLQLVANWPQLPPGFKVERVSGVAVNSRGQVYVAHRGEHPLLAFESDGRFRGEIGADVHRKSRAFNLMGPIPAEMEERHWLHGLHVDPQDNIWVTDCGRHLVFKFDPAGRLLLTLGQDGVAGTTDRLFWQPTQVCVMPSGEYFITDGYGNSRVLKFAADGKLIRAWGRRGIGPGEFHTPHDLTLGRDGLLYVSDRENDRIQIFDQAGQLKGEWPGLHSVDGVCAAPDGKIYGGAGLDNAVIEFDAQGRPAQVWAEPGFFCYPHGIAVDKEGSIYIAEVAGNRVAKLRRG